MYVRVITGAVLSLGLVLGLTACEDSVNQVEVPQEPSLGVMPCGAMNAGDFRHAPVLRIDGTEYFLAGAPDGPEGATDIPGHYWVVGGDGQLTGKHFNGGPYGAPQWWSSDAPDGELLYIVHGIVDTWTPEKARAYAERGFIHYH